MSPPPREPDLKFGGFSLWVHGRQFPDSGDYWDGNWLQVTARMTASGAVVDAEGPIIHVPELAGLAEEVRALIETLDGTAGLHCLEPNLDLSLQMDRLGHVAAELRISPEPLDQSHTFRFALDQTYLGPLLAACEAILERYSIKGSEKR